MTREQKNRNNMLIIVFKVREKKKDKEYSEIIKKIYKEYHSRKANQNPSNPSTVQSAWRGVAWYPYSATAAQ